MSDWHFGMDYDMWLYPPVDWTAPDYDYELPEPIEAANIEGTLLVNAEDAIEQVHCLQTENDKLRELVRESLMDYRQYAEKYGLPPYLSDVNEHLDARLRELGIEVDE